MIYIQNLLKFSITISIIINDSFLFPLIEGDEVKLNRGDRVRYDNSIYETVAVILSTVYLRKLRNDNNSDTCINIDDVYETYRDVEILKG